MRTGPAAGSAGYYHEALCYSSPEELLAVGLPFLIDGVEAGEPTLVAMGGESAEALRDTLPAGSGVEFLTGGSVYARPTSAIRAYRQMLSGHVERGATQIRIIGELPPAALGATWDSWARYESAVNRAYDEFPLWTMCAYDTRTTPQDVLADVARTHPHAATADGRHLASGTYTDPVDYLARDALAPDDPMMAEPPALELIDPLPVDARRAVHRVDGGRLSADDLDDLVVAVSEVVTNALRYGRPPTVLRLWAGPDRMVATVTDGGAGPKDPFAGLLPATEDSAGGRGLWIAYQSVNHVVATRTEHTFTLRLTAGNANFTLVPH